MNITIEFYGRLKSQFSATPIQWQSQSTLMADIYQELCLKYNQTNESSIIKPIINDTFCDWQQKVNDKDIVGFFPPASGG